jgi:hypothetical protein
MFYFLSLSLHTSKKKKKKNTTRISKSKPARHNTASLFSLSLSGDLVPLFYREED